MKNWVLNLALFFLATMTYAQVTTAGVSGHVTDNHKEPLMGASVIAKHLPTGTIYGGASRSDGSYNLSNMRVGGPYRIEFSYIGFQTEVIEDVTLVLGEELRLSVVLKEEDLALEEVVVVANRNSAFSSNRTGAQEIISKDRMEKLPTVTRSLADFTRLSPMNNGGNFAGASYRFNNVTVDGASFNNSFGLSSSLGAAGVEPISLETLEQVQVMIAPYDVRNGGFTGAGVNAITKSGSNTFNASAYAYMKSPSLMGYKVGNQTVDKTDFSNKQYGVSLSGALIKNKLFFYVNGEIDRIENPISFTTSNSATKASDLQNLSNFLNTELGYNPGVFDLNKYTTQADRLTARIDWNINEKNTLSLKYYYLKSFNTNSPSTSGAPKNGRGPNEFAIPFASSFYRANNNFNIVILDLNTQINNNISNTFKAGYSRLRDFRDMDGGFFPQVDILNGNTSDLMAYTTFGTEANSYNNKIDSDIWQIQDNLVINKGKHQITIGTQSDYRTFKNGFAQNYPGSWLFSSIDDFKFNVLATKDYMATHGNLNGFDIRTYNPVSFGLNPINNGIPNNAGTGLTNYIQKYSIGNEFPYAHVDVMQLGFYVQDKWSISDKLNLTFGLRADIPIFLTNLLVNENLATETFRDGIKIDVSKYPNTRVQLSPRFGFNFKPDNDGNIQLRGGTGLFSGTPPYVWLSNQAGNNGVLFGDINLNGVNNLSKLGFSGDIDAIPNALVTDRKASRADISVTDPKFRYPTLWKSNIAIDYRFGDGWIATVEALHSKDLNAIYHDNIGLKLTEYFVNDGSGVQKRPFYNGFYSPSSGGVANNVIMLRNTNKGFSVFSTFQLQKTFNTGALKGLYINGSYTMGYAESVADGTSSVAFSAWRYRPALDPNSEELGLALGSYAGRGLLSASYTLNWNKNVSTNIGLVYQRYRTGRYTYTYNGDANGDRQTSNDPIYIPRSFDEVKEHLLKGEFASVEEAWKAMDAFISQDPYLNENRGSFAKRNGGQLPFVNQLDLSLLQDFKLPQRDGRTHTLRFSFNIANFLNLLNKDWGIHKQTTIGNQQYQFLTIPRNGNPSSSNDYKLTYTMNKTVTETYKDNIGTSSRWQMQFGIKYIF